MVYKFKPIRRRPGEDSSGLSSSTFGRISWNLFIMLSQLKKLFPRANTKEKDKTGILKNAALKWFVSVFSFSSFFIYGAFKYRIKTYGLSWIIGEWIPDTRTTWWYGKTGNCVFIFGIIKLYLLWLVSYLCSMYWNLVWQLFGMVSWNEI